MVSIVLPFPQRQTYLALVPLAAGLAGVLVARGGLSRATLVALGAGYVAFAFTFAFHAPSHHYHSLPLIPILALSIGTLPGFLVERLGRGEPLVSLSSRFSHSPSASPPPRPPLWYFASTSGHDRRLLTDRKGHGHTTRALYVDVRLRSPISYWGRMVGATGTRPRRHRTYPAPAIPSPHGSISPR
jgi:hypothetical protein